MAHKRNLKIGTRFDLKNQNSTTENIVVQKTWLQWFTLSWLFCICFWKFKHKQFIVLTNFWRWFHSNHMHQLIVMIFQKQCPIAARCSTRMHTSFVWFIFFFYFVFSTDSFFLFLIILQTTEFQKLIIFLWRI